MHLRCFRRENVIGRAGAILAALLILGQSAARSAQNAPAAVTPTPLTIDAAPIERNIGGGETQEYTIALATGQFAAVTARPNGVNVSVEVYAPDGKRLMTAHSPNGADGPEDTFVTAKAGGVYRVIIRPSNRSSSGKVTLAVRSARGFAAESAKIQSPRLRRLWDELFTDAYGNSGALAKFRKEREEAEGPLIEAIPGDSSHVLLTLIYPGDGQTRSVMAGPAPVFDGHVPLERFANTDLWTASMTIPKDTRLFYGFRVRRAVPLDAESNPGAANSLPVLREEGMPDPWNPTHSISNGRCSEFVLPDAPAQPYVRMLPGMPHGKLERREIQSAILKEKRSYVVYTPLGYDPKRKGAYGVLVAFDGEMYSTAIPTQTILDNLIAAHKIPPMMAVFVHSLQTRDRDLTCNAPFADFLTRELLPAVRAGFPGATHSARKTIVAGASFGGLCAAYCGLTHSETFGNVLSQSGSFWLSPGWENAGDNPAYIQGEGTISSGFLKSKRLPVRFYLEVGTFESAAAMLRTNRHVRDILLLKRYDVTYSEFHGGHDCTCWRGSLADGLLALTRDWTSQPDRPANLSGRQPVSGRIDPALLDRYTGRYEIENNNMGTVTVRDGRLFLAFNAMQLELLPISEDTFVYAQPDVDPQQTIRLTFKAAQQPTQQLVCTANGRETARAPYISPLMHTLTPQAVDPDPGLTRKALAALQAMQEGGNAMATAADVTSGCRADFAEGPLRFLPRFRSFSYIAVRSLGGKGIERHGSKVDRVLFGRLKADNASYYALVYLTADNQITDQDLVDD